MRISVWTSRAIATATATPTSWQLATAMMKFIQVKSYLVFSLSIFRLARVVRVELAAAVVVVVVCFDQDSFHLDPFFGH